VAELVIAHKKGKDVNLNRLKCDIASKYGLKSQPKLVDIIGAVPQQFKVLINNFSLIWKFL
jgi:elongator complex protein 3